VRAGIGARYAHHSNAAEERVDLEEGTAFFTVSPHAGRRVLIHLPDGEIEDLGTTFEVTVQGGQTTSVAVSDGRVWARLNGQKEINLGAGEHWERPVLPAAPLPRGLDDNIIHSPINRRPEAENALKGPRPHALSGAMAKPAMKKSIASTPEPSASSVTADSESARAEDTAYLKIVSLLRQQQSAEARAQAKAYLLRFPNGFRRVEVLDIATGSASDAH
jgi:hypothetical protein